MKRAKILLLLMVMITISGCGNRITEGEVFNKEYIAAHTDTMLIPIVHNNSKNSYTTIVPVFRTYPDTWVIFIKAYSEEEQEWLTEDYYVSEEVYDDVCIGDWFVYDEDLHQTEQIYTQEEAK